MLCSRVLSSVLPAGPKGARRPRRGAASAPRAFHYDVQEMEDDEARRAREAKEREAFKASVKGGKRLFPKGIDPKDYTIEQLAFLSRKEQGIMPDMNDCAICDGVGTLICTACHGTGTNPRSNSDKFGDTVSVLLGRGDGTFEPGVQYDMGDLPRGLAVFDMDGDGDSDGDGDGSLEGATAGMQSPETEGFIPITKFAANFVSRNTIYMILF